MRKFIWSVMVLAGLITSPALADLEIQGLEDYGTPTKTEVIPTRENFIVDISIGRPPKANQPGWGQAHKLVWAAEEARQLGYFQLATALGDLYLTSSATIRESRLVDRRVNAAVRQVVRYAEETNMKFEKVRDPETGQMIEGVTLTMQVPLYGPNSIASGLQPVARELEQEQFDSGDLTQAETPIEPPPPPPAKPAYMEKTYTGLIVDTRGLGVTQAVSAKIFNEQNHVVYSVSDTDDDFAMQYGVVAYAKTGEEDWLRDRIGAEPIWVKANNRSGTSDAVVSTDDAKRIRFLAEKQSFLKEGRVVFLID